MKKATLFVICAALLLTAFAGCSGNKNEDNIPGDLSDLIGQIYANYNNQPDVKAALALLEENAPRVEELSGRMNAIYNEMWADGVTDDDRAGMQAELDGIEAELSVLREPEKVKLMETPAQPLSGEGTGMQSIGWFIGDGNENIGFSEGAVSEPMFGGGFSLVLLRMEKDADIDAAKTKIKNGKAGDQDLNAKWVCYIVDPSDFIVDSIGDLLVVIISDKSKELHQAFKQLAQ